MCVQIAGDFAVYGSSPSLGHMLSGILTTKHSQQLKSLLCFCCFWSQLKVNRQVFGIDEQCVLGHSTASQSLLGV